MNETFEASNGVTVMRNPDDGPDIDYQSWSIGNAREVLLAPHEVDALREFFQHERDQELGRWRYNPYLVIYRTENHQPNNQARSVYVLDERTGKQHMRHEGQAAWRETDHELTTAAAAYFAAHPEPKPWHDAKPGEAWVITYGGDEHAVISDGSYFLWEAGSEQPIDDSRITDGDRIYPEVAHG